MLMPWGKFEGYSVLGAWHHFTETAKTLCYTLVPNVAAG